MSDMANPASSASAPLTDAASLDERLKRTDELRWLSSRYAPNAARETLVALHLLHQELARALAQSNPMAGKIRLQWWREALGEIAGGGKVRRHDLAEALGRLIAGRADIIAAANRLIDAFDDVIDDHLHTGGHAPGADHAAKHLETEAALVSLSALALDAGAAQHEPTLRTIGAEHLARITGTGGDWGHARRKARALPASLWPAIAHYATAEADGPLKRRWRILMAVLQRRLP